jgi:dTDP-glucose 4,6-dehydratase
MFSVLVIGSNSFSGSHYINLLLEKKIKVIGISRSKEYEKVYLPYKNNINLKLFKFYKRNLNSERDQIAIIKLIKKYNIKYIVNFASQGMVSESFLNPKDWYLTNTLSQINLFEKLKKIKFKKYVHITTPEVYGENSNFLNEKTHFNPSTPYAISRASADYHLRAINKFFNFPVVFTRAANVYGPNQQLYRIIPKTIMKMMLSKKINIHGGGKSIRSFVHIKDVSEGYFKVMKLGKIGHCYHLSSEEFISIKSLIKKIAKILKKDFQKHTIMDKRERLGKDSAYKLSSEKIKKELKWKPKISITNGILDTIKWIKKDFKTLKLKKMEYKHKK